MKLKLNLLLGATALAAVLLPQAALADSLSITLNNPVQAVTTSGGALTFSGTFTAPSTNTGTEYLNGYSFNFLLGDQYYTMDDTAYLTGALGVDPGQSVTETLFTLTLNSGIPLGTYVGSFTLLGGATDSTYSNLGTGNLQVNVNAPAAAATPEPSSLLLLSTGALGAINMLRRRRCCQ